ncbi:DUF4025 domain-containing protein [Bacillus cytotoxicus]|uniref:DUF4025 domain-containing protein n=1 Tax=Bacillus cytotoxicus TaxID=580165 RepID=A0ACC6A1F4_9BACI|nr:DUF4025 domain-containing protein [Bacillus cytotoxicus]
MTKQQYKDTGKLTNPSNAIQKDQSEQAVIQEQISDTVAEGTIDVKLGQGKDE